MRFSYIFKQGIYRLLIIFLIDAIFLLVVYTKLNIYLAFNYPIPALAIYLILMLLFALTVRELKTFTKGAEGEQKVYRILGKLPTGYYRFWDFSNGQKGNIDMVVVGPTGIWTIEVKNYRGGEITLKNDLLCRNGFPFEKDFLKQAYAESKYLSDYIHKSLGLMLPVTPILVFANKFTKLRFGMRPINGVYVIGTSWLLNLIQERQISLTPEQCIKVKDEIKKYISII